MSSLRLHEFAAPAHFALLTCVKLAQVRVSCLALARGGFYAIRDPEHVDCIRCAYCRCC